MIYIHYTLIRWSLCTDDSRHIFNMNRSTDDYNISERANTNEKITTYPLYKMSSRPTASLAKNQLRPGYWIKRIKLHGCSLGKKLSWTLLVVCSPTLFFFFFIKNNRKKITAITKLYLSAVVISARIWKPRKGNRDNYRTWRKEEETWATGNQPKKKSYRDRLLRDHKIHRRHGWPTFFQLLRNTMNGTEI